MTKYKVTGMSCAACQARVEKAVNAVEGVESCAVSLLTNSMGVEGNASPDKIIEAVVAAGYGASIENGEKLSQPGNTYEDALKDTESPKMKKRLLASLFLLIPLMYVSMGHMMWAWPVPSLLDDNPLAIGLYELLLSTMVMVINQKFFINGFKGLIHKSPNMDTLVALGATASYVYSVCALFLMTKAAINYDTILMYSYMEDFYFESAAMILTLITVGKLLEAISKGRTTDALKSLMKLAPQRATVIREEKEIVVPIEEVRVGDKLSIKPGENIPVDGRVLSGTSAINEAALTGESIPVDKKAGDQVYAATTNTNGHLICEATKVGKDTTLSQIIEMVSDAAATKAPIAKIADKVSGIFVPAVILIAFVTFIVWNIIRQDISFALARAVSVLVISCPCALGLATPVAIMVGNGKAAKSGILFKTAASLEETGKARIIALDKTGTITNGEPVVTDIIPIGNTDKQKLMTLANALESKSEHPLAKAITKKAYEMKIEKLDTSDFTTHPGNGVSAVFSGQSLYGGNLDFIKTVSDSDTNVIIDELTRLSKEGKTPLIFADNERILGIIAVADTIKQDSKEAIEKLKGLGMQVVMLTGDNENTARAIADKAGVNEVIASVKPDGKEKVIRELQERGNVIMVGDGINDAPALTRANIGIAIGAGADVAIDAADVVLMKSSLMDVVDAVRISRATLRNIHENLFWAFFYNVLGIPLAAGAYIAAFGWTLNPMFGAAAMSLSSFCVVTNALRLNLFKMNNVINDNSNKEIGKIKEEEIKMKISVEGMMCPHCEAHVKEALLKIEGISDAVASHTDKMVTITTTADVAEADIKAAVEGAGYSYKGII